MQLTLQIYLKLHLFCHPCSNIERLQESAQQAERTAGKPFDSNLLCSYVYLQSQGR